MTGRHAAVAAPRWRRDLAITAASLLLLLAWDASGWDLAAAQAFAGPAGFSLRENFITSRVLHDGGRLAAWLLLALVVADAVRNGSSGLARAQRWQWIGVMLACLLLIPTLKRYSHTSCPWDLAQFGGVARYVSHWRPSLTDGGAGHCFPSGHAVAAFAFFGLYFQWRRYAPQQARGWLVVVLCAGLAFGTAQLMRGAHYPSHTLWSAWLCWALCAAADAWLNRPRPSA